MSKKYIVKVVKTYEYLKCVINEDNTLADLKEKIASDLAEEGLEDLVKKLNFEISSEYEEEIPIPNISEENRNVLSKEASGRTMGFYIRELVDEDVRQKYGELDYDKNPGIYRAINKPRDGERPMVVLTQEVAEFYEQRTDHYLNIIRRVS